MIKALNLNDVARYSCFAHRINTVLEVAWENLKETNMELQNFQ